MYQPGANKAGSRRGTLRCSGDPQIPFHDSEMPVESLFLVPAGGGSPKRAKRASGLARVIARASRCAALLGHPAVWVTLLWYRRSRRAMVVCPERIKLDHVRRLCAHWVYSRENAVRFRVAVQDGAGRVLIVELDPLGRLRPNQLCPRRDEWTLVTANKWAGLLPQRRAIMACAQSRGLWLAPLP